MGTRLLFVTLICLTMGHHISGAPSSKINSDLLTTFKLQSTANIFVHMKEKTRDVIAHIPNQKFATRGARINAVVATLETLADSSQKSTRDFLDSRSIKYKSFWISNQIFIEGATLELAEELASLSSVDEISEEVVVQLDDTLNGPVIEDPKTDNIPRALQWGVQKIKADQVWSSTGITGRGIVVGGIDTGARYTHQDLRNNYRTEYGWLDPTENRPDPWDNNGHGTHTIATIAGADGIGVAKDAKWIACKGCASSACFSNHLQSCGEWMLCPTRADGTERNCNTAPNIVSNSWAGGRGNPWYDPVIDAWIAAGIIPMFAQGNAGSRCSTDQSPGDRHVIGVGSTTSDDSLSYFSSRGPSIDFRIKPEVSAPGSDVLSAYYTSDSAYMSMSGTSMACPHAAGTVALVLQARNLDYEGVRNNLMNGADTEGLTPPNTNCGGINDTIYPNNAYGAGRINALRSVQAAIMGY